MWVFLSILFFLGFLHTSINITLIGKMRGRFIACLSLAICILLQYPLSAKINIQRINDCLSNFSSLSAACCYQVFESVVIMLVSLLLIRNRYTERKGQVWETIALFPAGLFIIGLFLIQTYFFHVIESAPFWLISVSFSFFVFWLLFLISVLLNKLVTKWEWKMELKVILSFIQALMAMFLPLVVLKNKVGATQFEISFMNSLVPILTMAGIFGLGLLKQKYLKKENLS